MTEPRSIRVEPRPQVDALERNRLLIVGGPDQVNVGAHFKRAGERLGLPVQICDTRAAYAGPLLVNKLNWWFRGHYPTRLGAFSREVVRVSEEFRPTFVLTTGIAPLEPWALGAMHDLGARLYNYLTDDPWNRAHKAPWFMHGLPLYDHVFSPRTANLEDLQRAGCKRVSHLYFAYAPEVHYPEAPASPEEREQFDSDVVFIGTADKERVPHVEALIKAGFGVGLYGTYWRRFPATRSHSRGPADPRTMRKAMGGARVALCLVRRSNRDEHSMRTFEMAAVGSCMLVEDTGEHRAILGPEGEAVTYFRTIDEMLERVRWLLAHDEERQRLARAVYERVTQGGHTYLDRLKTILDHMHTEARPESPLVAPGPRSWLPASTQGAPGA